MKKHKRWQLFLILTVATLTVYNILPTVFFYSKPLKEPIGESKGNQIALNITNRINSLETSTIEWIHSFCKLIEAKPQSVQLDPQDPERVLISFQSSTQAQTFRELLPRAGALIPFAPSQLSLYGEIDDTQSKIVTIQRKI